MKPKRTKSRVRSLQGSSKKVNLIKEVETTPNHLKGRLCPTNLQEEKEKFLQFGLTPQFKLKESADDLDKVTSKKRGQIHFDLFDEAKVILDLVKHKYGDGNSFLEAAYGRRINHVQATNILTQYLNENNVAGELTIYWAPDLTASARMMWHGPNLRYNKPEARRYTLIIKNSVDNALLREQGIPCLADHEIGTHYFRMINDGLQPWFSDRKKFGLRGLKTRELMATEEGLACLNTLVHAKCRYMYTSAILYYVACKAASMSFKELFDHLTLYIRDPDIRWKHVMRVKRGLSNPGDLGGYGGDQCYFEGAVEILRNLEKIDFLILHSGKMCLDEVSRVHRVARTDCIRIPKFLRDQEKYRKTLRHIGLINKIISKSNKHSKKSPGSKSACPTSKATTDDKTPGTKFTSSATKVVPPETPVDVTPQALEQKHSAGSSSNHQADANTPGHDAVMVCDQEVATPSTMQQAGDDLVSVTDTCSSHTVSTDKVKLTAKQQSASRLLYRPRSSQLSLAFSESISTGHMTTDHKIPFRVTAERKSLAILDSDRKS